MIEGTKEDRKSRKSGKHWTTRSSSISTYGSGDRRASLGGGSRGSRRTACTCVYTQWRENTGGWLTSPGKFFTFSLLLILIFPLPLLVPRVRTSFIEVVFLVQFVIVHYANRSIDTERAQSLSDRDTDMGTGAILGEPAIGMREKRVDAKLYREDEACNSFLLQGTWKGFKKEISVKQFSSFDFILISLIQIFNLEIMKMSLIPFFFHVNLINDLSNFLVPILS